MTTELDLKQETNVVKFDPSIILEDAGTASENMTNDDMLIPRLRILQALSPQVKKNDPALYIVSEEESFDIDHEWQFEIGQRIYGQ